MTLYSSNRRVNSYESIQYLRKRDLLAAIDAAKSEKRNRQLCPDFVEKLPEDLLFLVHRADPHTKEEVRLQILFKYKEQWERVFLDISDSRFTTLPTAKVYEDGIIEYETEEEIESRQPYANKRHWVKTSIRKPVRNPKFRKIVLEAYNNQCAVCDFNASKSLRAAHIVPVTKGGEDSIDNGICLCANHEIAFDAGLLIITHEFNVILNTKKDLLVKYLKLRLPTKKENYPSVSNLSKKLELLNISLS